MVLTEKSFKLSSNEIAFLDNNNQKILAYSEHLEKLIQSEIEYYKSQEFIDAMLELDLGSKSTGLQV